VCAHVTLVLFRHCRPSLSGLDHLGSVEYAETEPMVDMVTTSVHRPPVFLVVGYLRCLYDYVLHVPPREGWTEHKKRLVITIYYEIYVL